MMSAVAVLRVARRTLNKMRRYFAYGSNMSKEQMAEPDRAPDATKVETATLSNYEFFIDARGVASIREKQGKEVLGVVYEITETDEKKLDVKEGFPKYYIKKELPMLNAFSYIDQTTDEGEPREGYLERIIKAAKDNDLPSSYVQELGSWSK